MKAVNLFLIIIVSILFVAIFSIFCYAGYDDDYDKDGKEKTPAEQAQEAISNKGDYSGSVPAGTQVNLPGGGSATVSGSVVVSGGKISSADSITYGGTTAKGATNFEAQGDSYSIGSATELRQGTSIITNGKGIRYSAGRLTAQSYDSFTGPAAITTNGQGLDTKSNSISVSQADNLISGQVSFSDIRDTEFNIYSNAVEARPSLGVNLTITDGDGNEVLFEACSNDSSVIVTKDEPSKYIISKGILTCSYSGKKDALISNSTSAVTMGMQCFLCMQLNPVATYWHTEDFIKDFGVNVPKDSEEYKLCLRKLGNEQVEEYDGLVDLAGKEIVLGKIVNYIRYSFFEGNLASLLAQEVYSSFNQNKAVMQMDNDFIFMNSLKLTPAEEGNISITRNAHFEIIETGGKRFLTISKNLYPDIIKEYQNTNIDNVVKFDKTIAGTVLTQAGRRQ